MLHNDRLTFALLMCKIHLKGTSESNLDAEFNFFLRSREGLLANPTPVEGLSGEQVEGVNHLATRLPIFRKLLEKVVPQLWDESKALSPIVSSVHQLLLIQAFRPDRVIAAAHNVVNTVLGEDFMPNAEQELDFANVVDKQLNCNTPALLCSVPGFDASGRVDDLAAEQNKQISSIAIGSAEGFNQAERAINMASKSGRWVLLKNVHLAPQWLVQLEKKMHSLQPHSGFRLFLTTEINPKVPVNLLRAGRIFVFEPPPGIRANLLRTFSTVPAAGMMKAPSERARLYFLLAWFHAIVQERLRYVPLGWAKKYEFNESDLRVACDTLDTWIDTTAMGRTNLPLEKVPWDALITLLSQSIYGGKIDNDFDQRLLTSFLKKLFTARSFEAGPTVRTHFEREVTSGARLLQTVILDLQDVVLICQGEKKQTNHHRSMLSELVRGIIPKGWKRYTVPAGCTVIQWITDFSNRVQQLQKVSQLVSQAGAKELQGFPVWLGGLVNPEAYITATRQCVAQANSWSLEELALEVTITDAGLKTDQKDCCFGVTGLKLQGAQCKNNELLLASTIMMDLSLTILKWVKISSETRISKLTLPVYLNSTRTELLFTVDLAVAAGQDSHSFYERGVAVLTSTALN
ncbi:hypothetical protein KR026_001466 [Drosophila bipectinata]|nr:hypothetical protein KR026_001466 [Drosophila bipectinata]